MLVSQAEHIKLPLEAIERIYKSLISFESTDDEIEQLYAELINILLIDTITDLIKFTQEKSEASVSLQLKLTRLVFDEYNRMEKFLLSELKKYPLR
jgi:hypothetical protein